MTMDIRHIRSASLDPTAWTTLTQARTALNGPGYNNALMQDLYTTTTPGATRNDQGTLVALLRITSDHRVYLYYEAAGVVNEVELIFGFA